MLEAAWRLELLRGLSSRRFSACRPKALQATPLQVNDPKRPILPISRDPGVIRTLVEHWRQLALGQAGSIELIKELAPFEGPTMVKPLIEGESGGLRLEFRARAGRAGFYWRTK
jgi:hypothetical protein